MLRDCPWSEKRWDCSKVVQDDVKKKNLCGRKRGRRWGALVAPAGSNWEYKVQACFLWTQSVWLVLVLKRSVTARQIIVQPSNIKAWCSNRGKKTNREVRNPEKAMLNYSSQVGSRLFGPFCQNYIFQ